MTTLQRLLIIVVATIAPTFALAQSYPTSPIRLVVGYAPGGTTDSIARVLSQHLQDQLGQPVVVENRPGASTQIATDTVIKAKPDGYTLLLTTSDLTILPGIRKTSPWDVLKDVTPVAMIATSPFVYTVSKGVPVSNLKDFVALAKSKPGGLRYGSAGTGSVLHLVGEMLKVDAGIDVIHVPYRGGAPIVQDLLANQIEMGVIGPVDVSSRMDTLKPLAQTGKTRHASIPSVPTTAEAGSPNLNISTMFILVGPAGLPKDVVGRLNAALAKVVDLPDFRKRMEAVGAEINVVTGAPLEKYLSDDLKRWKGVAQAAGISIDQ